MYKLRGAVDRAWSAENYHTNEMERFPFCKGIIFHCKGIIFHCKGIIFHCKMGSNDDSSTRIHDKDTR